MFQIEVNAHYLIFWTHICNFHAVRVIYTNYVSNSTVIFYILGLSSILFLFFFRSPHFEIPENVM